MNTKSQNEWLKTLLKNCKPSGFDPYVETHNRNDDGELEYGKWQKYEGQKQIDERSVFPNELVIDIDTDTTEKAKTETRKVVTLLEGQGLPFYVADTGGTGYHLHIFFQHTGVNWKDLRPWRLALYNWLKSKAEDEVDAETSLWDDGIVDYDSTLGKGHLVRAIGGRKNSTGHRKTAVTPSGLEKQGVTEEDGVEYPVTIDFWRIKKVDGTNADLTWAQIQEKAEEIEEEHEQKLEKKLETTYEAQDDGLDAARNVPATEVLKLIGVDAAVGEQIPCPIHDDENPSAKITDGTESKNMPENRLGCFSDTCTEPGEQFHMFNAIDILVETGEYDFKDAINKLSDEFGIDVGTQSDNAIDPSIYFEDSEKLRGFKPNKLAKDIEVDYDFVYAMVDENLFVYIDGKYDEHGERLVREECNKRLGDEFSRSKVNDTVEAIKTRPGVAKSQEEFRPPKYKINMANGVYNLESEELEEHSPKYMFTQQIPHDYDPEAKCPEIKSFFREITETKEDARTLMELSGYAMLPNMPIDAAAMLIGKGSNGKTMYLNTLKQLIGQEHVKDENLQYLEESRFGTYPLYRKLLVISDDLPSKKLESGGILKSLTGGGHVRAEVKNGGHFEFDPYATPIFACNAVPETKDQSDGFFRRWLLIDFPYIFTENPEESDPKQKKKQSEFELRRKLYNEDELKGYASEAIHALMDVIDRQKFSSHESAEDTRQKWNGYASPVMEFIYEYVEQGRTYNEAQRMAEKNKQLSEYDFDFIPKDELLELVSAYCESKNQRPPHKTALYNHLDDAGLYFSRSRTQRVNYTDKQVQIYRGLKYSDEFIEIAKSCESLQGLQTKLGISNARVDAHALRRITTEYLDNPETPASFSTNGIRKYVKELVAQFEESTDSSSRGVDVQDVIEAAQNQEYTEDQLEEVIQDLRRSGELLEPSPGLVKAN